VVALERSAALFRSLIEHGSDLVAVLDASGVVCHASPSHERMLGYRPEDLVGRSAVDLIHPDDQALVAQAFSGTAQGHETATIEFRYRHGLHSAQGMDNGVRSTPSDPPTA
jgi:PAS domain S-box-containing protein